MPKLCRIYAFCPIIYFQAQSRIKLCLDTSERRVGWKGAESVAADRMPYHGESVERSQSNTRQVEYITIN